MLVHIFGLLCTLTHAIQPGAAPALPAPLRDLVFGDINFLHTTDTHGWHAGHLLESSYSADWGDYLSFTQHLRNHLETTNRDLLVIDTGDRIEGNGLYDASIPRGIHTFPIFKSLPIDLISIGNHELYKNTSAIDDYTKLVSKSYLATNLDIFINNTRTPFADRSCTLTTKHGLKILAFGFIFDFTRNDKNTIVIPVEEVVRRDWFIETVRTASVDLILVIGHVALRQTELDHIYHSIREITPTPIQFFGGHFHIRDARRLDANAYALASGRFMETIGFASISGIKSHARDITFFRRYIDNNLFSLMHHSNTTPSTFHTESGLATSRLINQARTSLHLDETFGCSPKTFWMSRTPYPHPDSIFSLLTDKIFPDVINPTRRDKSRMIITNTGAIRFDIFAEPFTRDSTFIVSPFTSNLSYVSDVPWRLAKQVLGLLNGGPPQTMQIGPEMDLDLLVAPEVRGMRKQPPISGQIKREQQEQQEQQLLTSWTGRLTPGYTTHDDLGDDGDDTMHKPVKYFDVPNCVQAVFSKDGSNINANAIIEESNAADDEVIDLVFNEFLVPYVLSILNFVPDMMGSQRIWQKRYHYTDADVENYVPGQTFTSVLANWVAENWPCEQHMEL